MFDITASIFTIAGGIAGIASAVFGIAMLRRTPKLPKPPATPSCVILTGVEMQRPDGLFDKTRRSRDRLL